MGLCVCVSVWIKNTDLVENYPWPAPQGRLFGLPASAPVFQGHVASTPPFSPSNKDFVPFLLPLRLPLKIIPVFTPPPTHRSTSPSLTSSWSAADLPQPDPQVQGPPDGETCITVGLTVASAAFGSAIRPTGPNPYLTSPRTVPRPPKAPRYPSIDFFSLFQQKQRDFLSYMIYHNHIICTTESTGVQEVRQRGMKRCNMLWNTKLRC